MIKNFVLAVAGACCLGFSAPAYSETSARQRLDQTVLQKVSSINGIGPYQIQVTADRATRSRRDRERSEGDILLEGKVTSADDRALIEEAAVNTPGVTNVTNLIIVVPPSRAGSPMIAQKDPVEPGTIPDSELEDRVRRALALDGIDLAGVTIIARGGTVHFSGTKRNHAEIDSTLSGTLMVPGVENVKSDVKVR